MNSRLLFAGSLRIMARNRLRTLFMSIGVVVGVATLIAGQSLGSGANKQIGERVNKMFGPGTILIFSRTLAYDDLQAIEEQLDQVVAAAPRFGGGESEISYQGTNRKTAVFGHSENAEFVWNRGVISGRFFTSDDMNKTTRVALIGTQLAQTLFAEVDPIGEEILIGSTPFRIIGVLESVGIDPHGEDRDEDIYVPITTAMRRLNNAEYVGTAKIVVSDHEQVDEDADRISEILRDRHHIAAGEKEDFAIYTSKFAGRMIFKANRVLNTYLLAAAGVVLLVAAVVISNIMLVVVRERIAEIGLRKAVGATEKNISLQFLVETLGVTFVAGLMGVILGLVAATIISRFIEVPVIVTNGSISLGLAAAIVVGIASGILPARRAARLDPVEALR